jgi:hypothetical protein
MFTTNNYDEAWDGFYGGIKCQHGVYQYVLFYRDAEGITHKLLGGIQLIR